MCSALSTVATSHLRDDRWALCKHCRNHSDVLFPVNSISIMVWCTLCVHLQELNLIRSINKSPANHRKSYGVHLCKWATRAKYKIFLLWFIQAIQRNYPDFHTLRPIFLFHSPTPLLFRSHPDKSIIYCIVSLVCMSCGKRHTDTHTHNEGPGNCVHGLCSANELIRLLHPMRYPITIFLFPKNTKPNLYSF